MDEGPRRIAGSGEPLVLLHGIGHSRHGWSPVLDALEGRHEVLSLDLPGFGEAPALPAGVAPTVRALADAVEREMDAAGFRAAHLTGNSLGGWVALELARRGRARTVVAISPAGGGTRRERAYARVLLKAIHVVTRTALPLAGLAALPGPTRVLLFGVFFARPNRLSRDAAALALRTYGEAPAFAATCDRLFAARAPGLEEIRCPVTILWGTRDFVLFARQARYFTRRIPDVRLVTLDRLGHVPMSDDPERVASTILEGTSAPASGPPRSAPGPRSVRG